MTSCCYDLRMRVTCGRSPLAPKAKPTKLVFTLKETNCAEATLCSEWSGPSSLSWPSSPPTAQLMLQKLSTPYADYTLSPFCSHCRFETVMKREGRKQVMLEVPLHRKKAKMKGMLLGRISKKMPSTKLRAERILLHRHWHKQQVM